MSKEGIIVLESTDTYIKYQLNEPIYDEKGYPTWKYNDKNPTIITFIKHPLFDNEIKKSD